MGLSYAILGLRMMGWAGHVARMGEGGVDEFCWGDFRERWAVHVARMGEGRGVHRVLVGKPEGTRQLGW
jgi:hypothetical protein